MADIRQNSIGPVRAGHGDGSLMLDFDALRKLASDLPDVRVDPEAAAAFAAGIEESSLHLPAWRGPAFPEEDGDQTAAFLAVANAVNFSFWGRPKWSIRYRNLEMDGSIGLFAACTRALEEDIPLLEGAFLAALKASDLRHILRGSTEIPLFDARLAILCETGRVLVDRYAGSPLQLLRAAGGSAPALVDLLTSHFPSFQDVARFRNTTVAFHKRAQLVPAMLYARFRGRGWGRWSGMDRLSLFADYKLPQVLREHGILRYAPGLAGRIDHQIELPAGDPEEVQIRIATLWAGECIRRALQPRFPHLTAAHIDGLLWSAGQDRSRPMRPYHRTRSTFY